MRRKYFMTVTVNENKNSDRSPWFLGKPYVEGPANFTIEQNSFYS